MIGTTWKVWMKSKLQKKNKKKKHLNKTDRKG